MGRVLDQAGGSRIFVDVFEFVGEVAGSAADEVVIAAMPERTDEGARLSESGRCFGF